MQIHSLVIFLFKRAWKLQSHILQRDAHCGALLMITLISTHTALGATEKHFKQPQKRQINSSLPILCSSKAQYLSSIFI